MSAPAVVEKIVEAYGLNAAHIATGQKGYRNQSHQVTLANGQVVNVVCFKREPGILQVVARADRVAGRAAAAGLPVRTRYDQRLLKLHDNALAGVYHYLPGSTIAWEGYTKKHLKLLGWAMADLHTALGDLPPNGDAVSETLRQQLQRMQRYFAQPGVAAALRAKLHLRPPVPQLFGRYEQLLASMAALPGQHYLHMDMVRGNVLFAPATPGDRWRVESLALSGVIDFEKASYGVAECDLARTLAFLLVDCPKPPAQTLHYFLNSGYQKRGRKTLHNQQLIAPLVRLFLLHDFYKFLRHTPYESLHTNHHYQRTRDVLLKYGMIQTVNK